MGHCRLGYEVNPSERDADDLDQPVDTDFHAAEENLLMAVQLPYLSSYKNVSTLFEKIGTATVPDSFTHSFLQNTIGLRGPNDRRLISFLRNLGFIDNGNRPTPQYSLLKGSEMQRRAAIAEGIRIAYRPLFVADQEAETRRGKRLRKLISKVARTDDDMTARIATTFAAVTKLGDFKAIVANEEPKKEPARDEGDDRSTAGRKGLRTEFHYNLQIILPSNGTEEVYLHIFNAIRKTFQ
jgi:hypothetical protein